MVCTVFPTNGRRNTMTVLLFSREVDGNTVQTMQIMQLGWLSEYSKGTEL